LNNYRTFYRKKSTQVIGEDAKPKTDGRSERRVQRRERERERGFSGAETALLLDMPSSGGFQFRMTLAPSITLFWAAQPCQGQTT
jgi:hypothetical protein